MKCAKCGRHERVSGRRHSNVLLCKDCLKKNRGGNHRTLAQSCIEKTAQAAPSGNVKRKRGKARKNEVAAMLSGVSLGGNAKRARGKGKAKHVTYTMLAGLPPTRETYGVVMRERSER